MTTRRITPPDALPVSLAAARESAGADLENGVCALDGRITQAIKGIAGEVEHKTNRALITQTWRLTLPAFPDVICLQHAPLIAVTEIKYYDTDNVQRMLAPGSYVVDADSEPARITPALGACWPAAEVRPSAVQVTYTCGFGDTDTDVPDEIKQYILLRIEQQFAPGGPVKSDDFEGMLDRWRLYA